MPRPAHSGLPIISSVVAALLAGLAVILTAGSADATSYTPSGYASRLLALVNDARQQHGLDALVLAGGTTTVASGWTQHLADAHALSHNPQLASQLASHGSTRWHSYGENVGQGAASDPEDLFHAYMNSPEHRANILSADYRFVGVAVVLTGRRAWNTFDFVDVYGATPAVHHRAVRRTAVHHRAIHHSAVAPQPQPVQPTVAEPASPHPVAPATQSSRRGAASAGAHRGTKPIAHVEAVRRQLLAVPASTPLVVAAPVASALPVIPAHLPGPRSVPVAIALAVIALVAAARRWVLVVTAR